MDNKVVLLLFGLVTIGVVQCGHVCDVQGPVTQAFCELTYPTNPQSLRLCCLDSAYCPVLDCTDWTDVSSISTYYDLAFIVTDTAQQCDDAVITCVNSNFTPTSCVTCPP